MIWTPEKTQFKLWAPTASEVELTLYLDGKIDEFFKKISLVKKENGIWAIEEAGNLEGLFYTFRIKEDDKWLEEKPDIYAKSVGINGKGGMIINLKSTNPDGWENDKQPVLKNYTDAIIYEMHIRDISISENSGIRNKGKFLGITETGTKNSQGLSTGIDHLTELGITHVHLLPSFDFSSINEETPELKKYNWGYDPLNYNVPEGSYATDAYHGAVRIKEFKEMVQALHAHGIGVIMDVVYNHVSNAAESNFNQTVPGYFFRQNADNSFSNASACGNETASEKFMMRKFMIESVVYWANEYHLDGFRFDLMGIHDIETMNAISDTLHKINPSIIIYGEGWAAGNSPLPEQERAVKKNVSELYKIAVFSDDMRDGLKGTWNDGKSKGFVSGNNAGTESVKFGIAASVFHPQINYQEVNYSKEAWAAEPSQTINYVSCHDNHTLFDKLILANPQASDDEIISMDLLAQTIVLTSQGISFLHAGEEFLRTKQGVENSFESPDSINEINWDRKSEFAFVNNYYKNLIALRKSHPAFRMTSAEQIRQHLKFINTQDDEIIAYQISEHANDDAWKTIFLIFNGSGIEKTFQLSGNWLSVIHGNTIDLQSKLVVNGTIKLSPYSATILYQAE